MVIIGGCSGLFRGFTAATAFGHLAAAAGFRHFGTATAFGTFHVFHLVGAAFAFAALAFRILPLQPASADLSSAAASC